MNDDQKARVLERLKKLLALSRSTNEHEAAAAMAKAQQLMQELCISEEELELTDYAAIEAEALLVRPGFKVPVYVSMLRALITKAFGCTGVWDEQRIKYKLTWLGQKSKAQISAYSWEVLARLLKTKRAHYKFTALLGAHTPGKREALADTYCEGWVAGVSNNIIAEHLSEKEQRLLSLFMKQKFPHTENMQKRGSGLTGSEVNTAYAAGIKDGRQTNLHAGVQTNRNSQIKQTRYLGASA